MSRIHSRWATIAGLFGALILLVALPTYLSAAPSPSLEVGDHEETAIRVYNGLPARCGVERWAVKTGIDSDANKVRLARVYSSSIQYLTSILPPTNPPSDGRVNPVETRVWSVQATLLHFKLEDDSDYHLVIADDAGRTMIGEIPAIGCVGRHSPFLQAITTERRAFKRHFHVTRIFQDANERVVIKGAGFFDFIHGQDGVAPNGIELHPVLGIRFLGPAVAPASVATVTSTP